MTKHRLWSRKKLSFGVFIVCFFMVGIFFWSIPYSEANLPNSFYGFGVAVVFTTGALLCFYGTGFRRSMVVAGLVFPAVLMARVVVEGVVEPSRHNLWPLALMIAAVMGIVVAGAGALAGWLAARVFR